MFNVQLKQNDHLHYCLLLITCYNISWVNRQQFTLQQLGLTQRCLASYRSSRQLQMQSIKHCQLVLAAVRCAALHLLQSPRHRFRPPWTKFTRRHRSSLQLVTTQYCVQDTDIVLKVASKFRVNVIFCVVHLMYSKIQLMVTDPAEHLITQFILHRRHTDQVLCFFFLKCEKKLV